MSAAKLPFLSRQALTLNHGSLPALYASSEGFWISYKTLYEQIEKISASFGDQKRGLVFCCLPRTLSGILVYLAIASSGHAIAILDPDLSDLTPLIAAYNPEWIVASEKSSFLDYSPYPFNMAGLGLWRRNATEAEALHPDLFLLLLTSGSTGNPKTVRLSYKNIAANTEAIIASLGLTSDTRAVTHLPLYYSYGLSILHAQLSSGGSLILSAYGMMDREFWSVLREQKVTLFPGIPHHYHMLNKLGLGRIDVPTLNIFLQAGGKMEAHFVDKMWQDIKKRDGRFFIMYGQTEASPRMSCLPVHTYPEKSGTVGQALNGGTFEIDHDEIIYSGPNVMMGYALNRGDLSLGDGYQGRLRTGDLGYLDADNFLILQGRKQRFLKIYGQRISLDDIESVLDIYGDCCVLEEKDRLVILTSKTEKDDQDNIHRTLLEKTHMPGSWFDVRTTKTIPRLSSGKIDYVAARSLL